MASYSIATGAVAKHDVALAANTVDTITFPSGARAVEIITDGTAAIYVTVDGTTPVVSGDHTFKLPAVACIREIPMPNEAGETVKLISTGTPSYSVTAIS